MPRKPRYDSSDLEVLTGLDPVRRRPGMYTETQSPDHLAQEVIDNSVDEALAGFAHRLAVTLHAVSVYVLVAIVKKRLNLSRSPNLFEKTSLNTVLASILTAPESAHDASQLILL